MKNESDLIRRAAAAYDAYRLDDLPRALTRNSLNYYYLSLYPSLREMRPMTEADHPPYPASVNNLYIHIPFCSGVCDFCSYYLVAVSPRRRDAIARYLRLVEREIAYHAGRTALDVRYLYIGGGTPSLIPIDALERFLGFMTERGYLNPGLMGTLELHPEFFADRPAAERFLDILRRHGINRVSVGYQTSDDDLLRDTKRRHSAAFMREAMALLRDRGFFVNLDLMYGLAGQSLASWEATLRDAVAFEPDSVATYFLFVDPGTRTHEQVRHGEIVLPDHRHVQTQHLMAQLFLESVAYHELPNDFWAREVGDASGFRPERLPSAAITLPVGPGAYGHYSNTQLANVFDLGEYERRTLSGRSSLWRGYRMDDDEAFHRDVMFSLKNDPFIDCALFRAYYNRSPIAVFAATFERLVSLDLITIDGDAVRLTPKGRLCVEEIAMLFRHPGIRTSPAESATEEALLSKHNFAPTYAGE